MKKTFFYTLLLAICAMVLSACDRNVINNSYYYETVEQYNDEFTIYAADWKWDDFHYNWYYTFNDYKIMDRTLLEYSSVSAYEVRKDGTERYMRALPYSQTWWDEDAQDYYTLELGYDYGKGWITFNFTDSFHNQEFNPGDITIRVCVQYARQ